MSDSQPHVTDREFALLQKLIEDGFDGVHSRLDKLNGKTDNHAARITVLETKEGRVSGATVLSVLALILTAAGLLYGIH